jgi:hypothetical protein
VLRRLTVTPKIPGHPKLYARSPGIGLDTRPHVCSNTSQVINMKTPLECDGYTEILAEDEMDQDLKKALKQTTEAITVLAQCQSRLAG